MWYFYFAPPKLSYRIIHLPVEWHSKMELGHVYYFERAEWLYVGNNYFVHQETMKKL